jgi:steroid 5-alpha reductase family enzyme
VKKLLALLVLFPLACLAGVKAAAVLTGVVSIGDFLRTADPLIVVLTLAGSMAVTAFLLGMLTDEYSWADRLWSTAPVIFSWVYLLRAGGNMRLLIVVVLITLWGARLTFNFARRGGYTSSEDYRWPILRQRITSVLLWQLFNLLFICGTQIGLMALFTLPVYALSQLRVAPVSPLFLVVGAGFLLFLLLETIADHQQWEFQQAKHGLAPAGAAERYYDEIQNGFRSSGLFRYSRHPAYFGELMVWWSVYLLTAVAADQLFHYSGIGAVALTLLFVGSTRFTESITASRYPAYAEYQQRTSAIIPWFSSPAAGSEPDRRQAPG